MINTLSGGIGSILPTTISFSQFGLIFGHPNSSESIALVGKRDEFGLIAGLLIPKYTGLKIKHFCASQMEYDEVRLLKIMCDIHV